MTPSPPLLRAEKLNTFYDRSHILRDVSLAIRPGETIGLMGRNGMGKTTLIRTLMGLVRPRSGRIRIDADDMTHAPTFTIARRGLAYVPEGRRVFPALTVAENLQVANRTQRGGAVEEIYGIFPKLAQRKDQLAGTMSGGEQQMLALGRALISKPALLLADEISLGLAPLIVESLFEVLVRLNREGMAILLAEQNAREALGHANRAYVMETGRITISGPAAELAADPRIVDAYLQMN